MEQSSEILKSRDKRDVRDGIIDWFIFNLSNDMRSLRKSLILLVRLLLVGPAAETSCRCRVYVTTTAAEKA